jgi:hypothetical protein
METLSEEILNMVEEHFNHEGLEEEDEDDT